MVLLNDKGELIAFSKLFASKKFKKYPEID